MAFTNQSSEPQDALVEINSELVESSSDHRVRRWQNSTPQPDDLRVGPSLKLRNHVREIMCVAIEGVKISPRFSLKDDLPPAEGNCGGYNKFDFASGTRGMLISIGTGITSAYTHLQETHETIRSASLEYHEDGEARLLNDED